MGSVLFGANSATMIVEPLLFCQKKINLHRKALLIVLFLLITTVWTFRLGTLCFYQTGLIAVSILSFVCWEQKTLE